MGFIFQLLMVAFLSCNKAADPPVRAMIMGEHLFEEPMKARLIDNRVVFETSATEGKIHFHWADGGEYFCDFWSASVCTFLLTGNPESLEFKREGGDLAGSLNLMTDMRASLVLSEGLVVDSIQIASELPYALLGVEIRDRTNGEVSQHSQSMEPLYGKKLLFNQEMRLHVQRDGVVREVLVSIANEVEPLHLKAAHVQNPYPSLKWLHPLDLQGWGSDDPNFQQVLDEVRPPLIIEVGSWKGASALHMLDEASKLGFSPEIICIDTWLGAREFWGDKKDKDRYLSLRLDSGYPSVYFQFLSNVIHKGRTSQVVPLPMTSLIAARWLMDQKVEAKLIYVDASHDFEDVLADLRAYWPLLASGGILFGDDYNIWPGVTRAVQEFASEKSIPITERNRQWVLRKH